MLHPALALPLAYRSSHPSSATSVVITILVSLVFVGGIIWIGVYLQKKRAAAMRVAAEELRLRYHEANEMLAPATIGHFHLGSQGHARQVRNSMGGAAGDTQVTIFDYSYTIGSGKSQSTYSTTAVRFIGSGLDWPIFQLSPEGFFSKIGAAFGGQDIDFESHPLFSKQYVLKGPDEAAIRGLFDETLLSAFEAKKPFTAEARGNELLYYRPQRKCKPIELRNLLAEAHGVYADLADAARRRG